MRWRRKTRWPFKETDKLLRDAGEGLRRRVIAIDESFLIEFFGTIIAALAAWAGLAWLSKFTGLSGWSAILPILSGLLLVAVVSAWRITRLWQERSNCFLGWFGERVTAENLRPLQLQGYQVFHDVPCASGKNGFNIDHVVVGPTGLAVVETKTRRKGNARRGHKDHEVTFDGKQLIWPWGEDRHGIQQTINEAEWLRKWVYDRTGLKLGVKRVLTLPGWFVRESPSSAIRVVNPKILPDVIRGRGEQVLSEIEIDLVVRLLDERCRDVAE
jgi:hypothetical protein